MAIWFGVTTGLAEVSILAFRSFYQERIIYHGLHVAWMAPLAAASLFVVLASILSLIKWQWPRLISLRSAAFLFGFLGFSSILFLIGSIVSYAKIILAIGLATQTSRFIARNPTRFYAIVRYSVGWLLVILVVTAVSIYGWEWSSERLKVAQLPPAPAGAPNVLLIVLDTVRSQNLSLYGYNRPTTPNLERLAKTGVVFERALSTSSWTLPAHASMFTGRLPHELSTKWYTPLDNQFVTLAEVLSSHGYLTAGFVANLFYCQYEFGLHRGFSQYQDYVPSTGEIVRSSALTRLLFREFIGYESTLSHKSAVDINKSFLHWVSQVNGRPFFAFLNYFDAHSPYLPPDPIAVKFGNPLPGRDPLKVDMWTYSDVDLSQPEVQAEINAYDSSIAYLDQQIGWLLNMLQKRGILKDTLVIITADHGEQFGAHGLFNHGNSLYRQLLQVPLIISFPKLLPSSYQVRKPVSLRDIPATVMEILGLKNAFRFPGISLTRYIGAAKKPAGPPEPIVAELTQGQEFRRPGLPNSEGDMKSVISHGMHYIKNGDGHEEIYDFESDPLEKHNLSATEEGRPMLIQFRSFLEQSQSVRLSR
jgi:arylsulfatase A-like enzyme